VTLDNQKAGMLLIEATGIFYNGKIGMVQILYNLIKGNTY